MPERNTIDEEMIKLAIEVKVLKLKEYCGALDPTCYSVDFFEGFNKAINLLSN
jgi:hypothetical protein